MKWCYLWSFKREPKMCNKDESKNMSDSSDVIYASEYSIIKWSEVIYEFSEKKCSQV